MQWWACTGNSASAMDVSAAGAVASTASAGSEKKSRAAPSSERRFGDDWVHIQPPGQRRDGPTGDLLLSSLSSIVTSQGQPAFHAILQPGKHGPRLGNIRAALRLCHILGCSLSQFTTATLLSCTTMSKAEARIG